MGCGQKENELVWLDATPRGFCAFDYHYWNFDGGDLCSPICASADFEPAFLKVLVCFVYVNLWNSRNAYTLLGLTTGYNFGKYSIKL